MTAFSGAKAWIIVAIRCIVIISSIVVLGAISSTGTKDWYEDLLNGTCVYNGHMAACALGEAAGSLSLIVCVLLVFVDIYFIWKAESSSDWSQIVLLFDVVLNFVFVLIWITAFALMTQGYGQLPTGKETYLNDVEDLNARVSLVFAFFAFFGTALLALTSAYRLHASPSANSPTYEKL
ncbi:uncharacterized protein [Oscarella lobularis]|uniref:uncharacterized protein n=1 Tax=Oscarella lobularis TaxID=121494 RepID=UPI00331322F8